MARALRLLQNCFVNMPYDLLKKKYWDLLIKYRLNPELYFSPQVLDKWPEDEFRSLSRELEANKLNVTIHAPFYDLSPGALDEKIRKATEERLRETLEVALIFKPKAVVAHLAFDPRLHNEHPEQWLAQAVKTWQNLYPLVEKCHCYLNLENVFETGPQMFLKLFQTFNRPLIGVCFDYGHVLAFTNGRLDDWQSLFPYIRQLHLHDNHGHQDEHLGLGQGIIDFYELFKRLKNKQIFPILTLEPHSEQAFWDTLEFFKRLPDDIYDYLMQCGHEKIL